MGRRKGRGNGQGFYCAEPCYVYLSLKSKGYPLRYFVFNRKRYGNAKGITAQTNRLGPCVRKCKDVELVP